MLGGGAGHILDMINTLKNNARLLKKRKSLQEIDKMYGRPSKHIDLEFKSTSPEELKTFHQQVLREKRRSFILQVIFALVFLAAAVVLTVLFIQYIV
jgi:hypothetical protein